MLTNNSKNNMTDKTNLQVLLWGINEIANNHGFQSSTENWADEGQICIFGGCNVPTLADVCMLCQDVGITKDCIYSSEFGIDIEIPEDWYESVGRSPFTGTGLWTKYGTVCTEDLIRAICEGIDISEVEDMLKTNGIETCFVDEKISNALDDEEDEYLMMRSFEAFFQGRRYYCRFFYGNNTYVVTYMEIYQRS